MKLMKQLAFLTLLAFFTVACGGGNNQDSNQNTEEEVDISKLNMENLLKEIEKREQTLEKEGNGLNNRRGILLMRAYAEYGFRFGSYEQAPEFLYKAGEMAMAYELPVEAIRYLDQLYNEYKDFEKRPYALFLKAFIVENQTRNYEEAERLYRKFIEEFPNHDMVDDAEYSIKNMGKTPEELIREFEIRDSIEAVNKAV